MTRSFLLVAGSLALAACSSETPTDAGEDGAATTPTPTSAAAESGGARGRSFAYTMLSDCETVREETEEGQYLEQECPGLGGYGVISTVGDLRANLQLAPPGGTPTSLDLSQIGGGGFSALGETLEWRGPAGKPLAPNSLIMRYNVVENPETNEEVSHLLVARLAPTPCVIAKVPPGAGQNAKARDLADAGADAGADCLAG